MARCKTPLLIALFLSVICLALTQTASAEALSIEIAGEIRAVLDKPESPQIELGQPILLNRELLPGFYRKRDYLPAWIGDLGINAAAMRMLDILRSAGREGLCSDDYHLETIEPLVALEADYRRHGVLYDVSYMARLDLLFTDAFLLYADHLMEGRVDPKEVHVGWRARPRKADLTRLLAFALDNGRLAEVLDGLVPPHAGYLRLRQALEEYRRSSALGGWPVVPAGPVLRPGGDDPRLPLLRRRLVLSGDLKVPGEPEGQGYDSSTEEAVRLFQRRHGLAADGVVGPRTLAALNVPVEKRIRQIEINLERWRWLPKALGRRYLWVNIADFRLELIEEEKEVLSMSVVVGTSFRRTPVFSARMTYLEFAPYWNVPPTILREDKLPLIKADPDWVGRHHYEIIRWRNGRELPVDPEGVPWTEIKAWTFPGVLRQKPGPWNPLGRVKFIFPNRFSVYLHDTPDRYLFDRGVRSFSSGCIRIERPLDLAQYLLEGMWDCERLLEALESPVPVQVDLPAPLPVHILYWTAWVDEAGRVQFRDDLYWRDLDLDLALQERSRRSEKVLQPTEGDDRSDGRADRGEEKDEQDPGHAVSPPAAQGGHVLADPFQVLDGGGGDERLDQAGDHAGADGRIK